MKTPKPNQHEHQHQLKSQTGFPSIQTYTPQPSTPIKHAGSDIWEIGKRTEHKHRGDISIQQ